MKSFSYKNTMKSIPPILLAPTFAARGLLLLLSPAVCATALHAEVKLPKVLSSHMVLQREMAVPIWGTAAPQETVRVEFAGQKKETAASPDGKWLVKLDPLTASSTPRSMTVTGSSGPPIALEDILVGEVWVGSGQSNMDMVVSSYTKDDAVLETLSNGTYPNLRLISKGRPGWEISTQETNKRFSAMLFSFGQPLQKELDVPVGLLVGAVGGTPSGYWLSKQAFEEDKPIQDAITKARATNPFDKDPAAYNAALLKFTEDSKVYAEEFAKFQKLSEEERKTTRPPARPAKPMRAGDSTGEIGHLYELHMRPFVGYGIRGVLWDQGESGTAVTGVGQFQMMGGLIRGWRKEWSQGEFPFLYIQKPSGGGCAYDYNNPINLYANKFEKLPAVVPGDGASREEHIKIGTYPRTAMVIGSDLGDGIHPPCKSGYGSRAATVALGFVYGKKVETSGPTYASQTIKDSAIHVKFTHTGDGLAFKNGDSLQGFAIAGEDKKFYWADARIDGETVVLTSGEVPKPQFVRYAWSGRHTWANLFNKNGLPAVPFRTDE